MASPAHRPRRGREPDRAPDPAPGPRLLQAAPPPDRDLPGRHGRGRSARGRAAAADPAAHRRRHPARRPLRGGVARRGHRAGGGRDRRPLGGQRLLLLADRRGPDLRPAHPGLRSRPAAVPGLLHAHPDRRAGQPPQQRRHRRPTGLHLHPVRDRVQRGLGGRRRGDDAGSELAGDPGLPGPVPVAPAHLPLGQRSPRRHDPRPDGRQRRPRQRHDRALQRGRRDAPEALRAPSHRGRAVRGQGRARPRPRGPHLAADPPVLRRNDVGAVAGHGARVRRRRLLRGQPAALDPAP